MFGKILGKIVTAPIRGTAYLIDGVDALTSAMAGTDRLDASEELHQACDEVEESAREIDE